MTNDLRLTLKPHPNCTIYGELIDVIGDGDVPWASVHVDTFYKRGEGAELHELLGKQMKTVVVELRIAEVLD